MGDCLFCKIASHEIPATIVAETADVVAFEDNNPQAPTHILVIPKRHIPSVSTLSADDAGVISSIFIMLKQLAARTGISAAGYRVTVNTGENAGQAVHHLHFHLLGGRKFGWPPG